MGQPSDEIAPCLLGLPCPDRPAVAEEPEERRQPVVPVVVAREGDQGRARGTISPRWEGGREWTEKTIAVLGCGRGGVGEITAQHEQVATTSEMVCAVVGQLQLFLCEEPRRGERRVEPIARVSQKVEPELL